MAKPFDATVKDLIERHPADWLRFFGATGSLQVLDADVSTVSAATDKVYRVESEAPWLLHVEFNSSPRTDPDGHVQWYNSLLRHRHALPVRTVIVLLRKSANSPRLNGLYQDHLPGEPPYLEFRYQVVRLWEQPVERLLTSGAGLVPLAPLANVAETDLPKVVQQVAECLRGDADASHLWTATLVLTGLRLDRASVLSLFQGYSFMSVLQDSSAYEIFVDWAKAKEARKILLSLGEMHLGPPPEATLAQLQAIEDLERLERMCRRASKVANWDELLATP